MAFGGCLDATDTPVRLVQQAADQPGLLELGDDPGQHRRVETGKTSQVRQPDRSLPLGGDQHVHLGCRERPCRRGRPQAPGQPGDSDAKARGVHVGAAIYPCLYLCTHPAGPLYLLASKHYIANASCPRQTGFTTFRAVSETCPHGTHRGTGATLWRNGASRRPDARPLRPLGTRRPTCRAGSRLQGGHVKRLAADGAIETTRRGHQVLSDPQVNRGVAIRN